MSYHFIAVWDMLGLESIFDVDEAKKILDEYEKRKCLAILKGTPLNEPNPNPIPLQLILLRARFNSQRNYEIYEFTSELDISEVKKLFENDPQTIVNWIRKNGYKVFGSATTFKQKIF
jgi:hypothetical protein